MPRWKELPEELDPQIRDFAAHMRRLVDRSGLTVSEVADRTGYSRSSWERYLNGRLMPSRESVVAFAEVTGALDDQLMTEWSAADRAWSRAELRNRSALRALRAAQPDPDDPPASEPGRQGRGLRGVLGRGRGRGEEIPGAGETAGRGGTGGAGRGAERPVHPDATERSAVRPGPPPPPERRATGAAGEGDAGARPGAGAGAGAVTAEEAGRGSDTGGDAGADAGTDTGNNTGSNTRSSTGSDTYSSTGSDTRSNTGSNTGHSTLSSTGSDTGSDTGHSAGSKAADPAARDTDETTKLRALSRPTPPPAPEPAGETARTRPISTAPAPAPPAAAPARKNWPLRRVLLAGLVTLLLTGSVVGVVYVGHGLIADPGVEEQQKPRGGPKPESGPAGKSSGSGSGAESPSETAELPEGVECQGDDCTGKDADEMGCGGDFARTTTQTTIGDMVLEIRYSEPCQAAWARITAAEPGSTVTALAEVPGEEPVREDSSAGTTEGYTAMVVAEELEAVRACAELPDGTAACTKGTLPS
ncbi:helix-turn-helix domain-containing protein [Streptomyces sp. NPDC004134]|uniref:helix-turn-helix domain-containing protein n=1 Tax=Streptomyces sp. NPDC004134 TaxID=3364691 RepID=UPI0036A7D85C